MPDNEMQIILTLVDNATKDLKKSIDGVKDSVDGMKNKSNEAHKKLQDGFKESASQARVFRRDLMLVLGIITSVVNATREYAKYNSEARESVDKFDLAVQKMSINAGRALMPVLKVLAMSAEGWSMMADLAANVMEGKGFVLSDKGDVDNLITAGQELKNIAEDQKQLDNLFITGKINVSEYYNSLAGGEFNVLQMRQQSMAQLKDLQYLQYEINNESLVQAKTRTDEEINLLKFYQEEHTKVLQGMKTLMVDVGRSVQTGLSGALTDIITGAKKAKDAFAEFGKMLLKTIVDFITQKLVAFALEKTLLAGTVASGTAAAAALAAAWGPAALAANIASFGGAATAAAATFPVAAAAQTASMGAVSAIMKGIEVSIQSGVGSAGPAFGGRFAEGGEGVVSHPTLFLAGEAGPERFSFTPIGKSGDSFGDINIQINYPQMGSQSDVQGMAELLGFEIERKLRNVRAIA